jgi:ADP-ribose pyrophosphatase YjhB (NUDIX family)
VLAEFGVGVDGGEGGDDRLVSAPAPTPHPGRLGPPPTTGDPHSARDVVQEDTPTMTIEHPAAAPSTVGRTPSPERAMVSVRCVIFDRDGQWVLVVRPAPHRSLPGQQYLYLPGGRVHEGEPPSAAADREVGEVLGLRHLRAGRLLLTAWTKPRYPQLRPRLHLLFDFGRHDRGELADRIVLLHRGLRMLLYRAALPLSHQTLTFVSGLVRAHRRRSGTVWRRLNPGQQALLVLVHLRKGETFGEVGAGFGVSTTTCRRYVTEAVELLAARAPKLRTAKREAFTYVVVDGKHKCTG